MNREFTKEFLDFYIKNYRYPKDVECICIKDHLSYFNKIYISFKDGLLIGSDKCGEYYQLDVKEYLSAFIQEKIEKREEKLKQLGIL